MKVDRFILNLISHVMRDYLRDNAVLEMETEKEDVVESLELERYEGSLFMKNGFKRLGFGWENYFKSRSIIYSLAVKYGVKHLRIMRGARAFVSLRKQILNWREDKNFILRYLIWSFPTFFFEIDDLWNYRLELRIARDFKGLAKFILENDYSDMLVSRRLLKMVVERADLMLMHLGVFSLGDLFRMGVLFKDGENYYVLRNGERLDFTSPSKLDPVPLVVAFRNGDLKVFHSYSGFEVQIRDKDKLERWLRWEE